METTRNSALFETFFKGTNGLGRRPLAGRGRLTKGFVEAEVEANAEEISRVEVDIKRQKRKFGSHLHIHSACHFYFSD